MHNRSFKKISLWAAIAIAAGAGAFLLFFHRTIPVTGPDITATSGAPALASADMQSFSGDGYAMNIPSDWQIEQRADDSVAVYDGQGCKVEMAVFPYSPGADMGDWISSHIAADQSLAVVEHSTEEVDVNGGTGVQWDGTIDGVMTTLVYAFDDDHAYEIAPSAVSASSTEDGAGDASCGDTLDAFVGGLTVQ